MTTFYFLCVLMTLVKVTLLNKIRTRLHYINQTVTCDRLYSKFQEIAKERFVWCIFYPSLSNLIAKTASVKAASAVVCGCIMVINIKPITFENLFTRASFPCPYCIKISPSVSAILMTPLTPSVVIYSSDEVTWLHLLRRHRSCYPLGDSCLDDG